MRKMKVAVMAGTFAAFLVIGAGNAFAVPVSMGGGVTLGSETLNMEWPQGSFTGPTVSWQDDNRVTLRQSSVGATLFLDAHFAALSVDLMQGSFDVSGRMWYDSAGAGSNFTPGDMFVGSWSATLINANLVGKFPIALFGMPTARVFPMLGAGYQIANVVEQLENGFMDRSFNNIRVLFGIGADFDLNQRVFLRFSVLPYYHLTRAVTLRLVDPANIADISETTFVAHGGFGMNAGVLVGFRFGRDPSPMP